MRKLIFLLIFWVLGPLSIQAQCTIQTLEILADTEGACADAEGTLTDAECAVVTIETGCKESQKFQLYPNPTTDIVYIKNAETVKIWDVTGRYLGSYQKQIDVSNWANGLYVAQFDTQIIKFVKQ